MSNTASSGIILPAHAAMLRFAASLSRLRPNDVVTVYHGTSLQRVRELINGFDANKVMMRYYQTKGYKHAGLFVSPSVETAEHFGAEVILEIQVRAKNLHGTDFSGQTGRHQTQQGQMSPRTVQWLKEKYPESFRPYLSLTMQQTSEPQAILRGLVAPRQIKRVRYRQPGYGNTPVWYTRRDFWLRYVVSFSFSG